jgi:hypothetical protein
MDVNSTGNRVKITVYALTAAVIVGFTALLWHSLLVTSRDGIEYSELDVIALTLTAVVTVLVIPVIWLGYRTPRLVHIAAIAILSSSIATLAAGPLGLPSSTARPTTTQRLPFGCRGGLLIHRE